MIRSLLFASCGILTLVVVIVISLGSTNTPNAPIVIGATQPGAAQSQDETPPPDEYFQLSFPVSSKFAISYTSLVNRPRYLDYTSIIDHVPPFYEYTNNLEPYTGEYGTTSGTGGNACGYLNPSRRDYCYNGHSGLDVPVPDGTHIYASHAGVVVRGFESGYYGGYGTTVLVRDLDNPTFITLYAHLSAALVERGNYVARGQRIGTSGCTPPGCGGFHLHWGLYYDSTTSDETPQDVPGEVLDPYGWYSLRPNRIGAPVTDYKWAKGGSSQGSPNEPQAFDLNEGTVQGHEYVSKGLISNGVFATGAVSELGIDNVEHWWADNLGAAGPPRGNRYWTYQYGYCQSFEGGTYCEGTNYMPYLNYSDVPLSYWAHRYIQWVVRENIAGGYSDGTFRPSNFVTRAQFSKMTVNTFMFSLYTPPSPTFCDVYTQLGDLYPAVETLVREGIISGYEPGSSQCVTACSNSYQRCFLPGDPVRRGQMTKFVAESARKKWGLRIEDTSGEHAGPDYWDVPTNDAFYQYIRTLHNIGAIRYRRADASTVDCRAQGYTEEQCQSLGHFFWGWAGTRAQTAQLLHETVYALRCPTGDSRCIRPNP